MINTMEVAPEELPGLDLFQNCRLCLAKEKVSVDIFSEGHEIRLLYYKIVSCLPVHVTQDDKLPRKICMQCNEKVDNFYQFWTLTAKSQKTLLDWVEKKDLLPPAKIKTENVPPGEVLFKQEVPDYSDEDNDNDNDRYEDDNSEEDLEPSTVVKVCEETEETAGGTTPGPSAGTKIKLSQESNCTITDDFKKENENFAQGCEGKAGFSGHNITNNRDFECKDCKRFYKNKAQLARHKSLIHADGHLSCNTCGKKFGHRFKLSIHMISHSNDRPFACTLCGKNFKTKDAVRNHTRIVHEGKKQKICKNYKCSLCPKAFTALSQLKDHQYAHTGRRPHVCHLCPASYSSTSGLGYHIKVVHEEYNKKPQSRHQCDHCGKMYSSFAPLKHHLKYNHGDAKPECHVCGKKVSSKTFLITHLNMHMGEKPFCCEYCGRSFVSKKVLIVHTRSHTGESPFKCSMCPKTFKQRSALTQHLKSKHPGENPKNCTSIVQQTQQVFELN